jgi:outer membrane protein assembly factor BamB
VNLGVWTSGSWAEVWPQWRGPKFDGNSPTKDLPIEWGPDRNIAWKFRLPGQGESTPCIWQDRIFLTTTAGTDVVLMCIGTNGQLRWQRTISNSGEVRYRNPSGTAITNASSSPCTDGRYVWAFVGDGTLVCYSVEGQPIWHKDIQKEYGRFRIQFGTHWTPVLYKDTLYLQIMHRGAQLLVAWEAATGREKWKVERPGYGRGESPDTYASGVIWEGQGGPLLVAHGNDYCTGHRLEDGAEVWRVMGLNPRERQDWRFVSSPMVSSDLIVVPSCKDGPTVAFNPVGAKGTIDSDNPAELWRVAATTNFRTPDVVSPLRVGDIVYMVGDGPFYAVEAKTGKLLYRADLTKAIHRANMVAADGRIYVVAANGVTDVVAAGPNFKKLASNKLPDTFYASPALADGRLYLRGFEYLWAIGRPESPSR